jgi:Serine carboxypeptidase
MQYGGYYGPTYIAYFQEQLKLSSAARGKSPISDLTFDTLGITNGCIDMMFQAPSYPQMAVNNTYALEAIPPSVAEEAATNHTKSGGCRDLIQQCRALGEQGDPQQLGSNATVNEACAGATQFCATFVLGAYDALSNVRFPPFSI